MAAAEVVVGERETEMTLTFPTGLANFADTDQNGQLAASEVQQHRDQLQAFLAEQIQFNTVSDQAGSLRIEPVERGAVPLTGQAAPNTHSTLKLIYSWLQPVQGLTMRYNLFLPGVPTASCLATILQADQLKTHVFTPQKQTLALTGLPGFMAGGLWLALIGAFGWGAIHSLSPGHGKTIVAAYLVGGRATAQHALFLAATTTITHTIGVFALGLATLFAAKYIVPEQLYRWLSLVSGLMIVTIGIQLLQSRLKLSSTHCHSNSAKHSHHHIHSNSPIHTHPEAKAVLVKSRASAEAVEQLQTQHVSDQFHSHGAMASHYHDHDYDHHDAHYHGHYHDHHHHHEHQHPSHLSHSHSHFPPGTDGTPVTWQSLLALGISGGLIPCPAALVLLLGCIALGNVGLGLVLVLAFSLGLAGVLTGMGLALVYAKQVFQSMPTQIRPIRFLPTLSAGVIALIGLSISTRAFIQVISGT
jgi:ABC-type nickel/cobalt efflux system permease component RcnA